MCGVLMGCATAWAICHGSFFLVGHPTAGHTETCKELSGPPLCIDSLDFYYLFNCCPVHKFDINVPEPFFPAQYFLLSGLLYALAVDI